MVRISKLRLLVVGSAAAAILGILAVRFLGRGPSAPRGPRSPLEFAMTGLDGGGFQNVVAIAPGSSDTVLSGGDVSGINRSNDLGVSYQISNVGLTSGGALKIAALAYHPSIPG
ncbi:MAG: hypothetical protein ACREJP_07370, partial [Candidatus Methylomirabilales bacterium]